VYRVTFLILALLGMFSPNVGHAQTQPDRTRTAWLVNRAGDALGIQAKLVGTSLCLGVQGVDNAVAGADVVTEPCRPGGPSDPKHDQLWLRSALGADVVALSNLALPSLCLGVRGGDRHASSAGVYVYSCNPRNERARWELVLATDPDPYARDRYQHQLRHVVSGLCVAIPPNLRNTPGIRAVMLPCVPQPSSPPPPVATSTPQSRTQSSAASPQTSSAPSPSVPMAAQRPAGPLTADAQRSLARSVGRLRTNQARIVSPRNRYTFEANGIADRGTGNGATFAPYSSITEVSLGPSPAREVLFVSEERSGSRVWQSRRSIVYDDRLFAEIGAAALQVAAEASGARVIRK
jgi:hypothetical protein